MHAWVMYSVLDCNVFKTKVHNPADRPLGTAMPGLEATAALPLMYGRMPALGGSMVPQKIITYCDFSVEATSTHLVEHPPMPTQAPSSCFKAPQPCEAGHFLVVAGGWAAPKQPIQESPRN